MADIKDLLARSQRAICGATERELTVKTKLKGIAIRRLRAAGYRIVGISYGDSETTKIWFVNRGSALL